MSDKMVNPIVTFPVYLFKIIYDFMYEALKALHF